MPSTTLLRPPRRRGNDDTNDLLALYGYLSDLWTALVQDAQLLNPAFAPIAIVEITTSGTEQTATYTFATERADTNYRALVQAKSYLFLGGPIGAAAFTPASIDYATTGFTVTFAATPGADNSITFDAFIFAT